MVSYDVASLFTNVPLSQTIDIILDKAFPTMNTSWNGLDRKSVKSLLQLAVLDCHFIFNNQLYRQKEGMAMGSPLGPTFANIFMSFLETDFINNCPNNFKPLYYRRYVDDILALFSSSDHAQSFLNYINLSHPNIQFTLEVENNNTLPFLDVLVTRKQNKFETSIYRKPTFSGLGLNYFSSCPKKFKLNACRTLIYRAFHICSSWISFHEEIQFLQRFFTDNCYPRHLFTSMVHTFLSNHFNPPATSYDVPKLQLRLPIPFLNRLTQPFQSELCSLVSKFYPFINLVIVPSNPLKLHSFFKFKDSLPLMMRSSVVYLFTCPGCKSGSYVGITRRMLKTRVDAHEGKSYRTGSALSNPEHSAIRDHKKKCKFQFLDKHFKILSTNKPYDLPIVESLFIKRLSPQLNRDTCSTPLHVG